MPKVGPFTFAAVMLLVACGPTGEDLRTGSLEQWAVAPAASAVVGGPDEREDYQLFRVTGATRLSDGRIVIANGGTSDLRYYSSDGDHLLTVGGEGDGPGEMRGIMQITALPGDTLLVLSFRPGLTWFDPSGAYVRSMSIDFWGLGGAECRIGEGNWFALADGSILAVLEDNFGIPGCPPSPPSPWRQSALVGRADPAGTSFDTLAIMPGTERNSPNYRVFGRSLLMAWNHDAVYLTDTGSDELLELDVSGDTVQMWQTPFEARPIPPEAKRVTHREFERPDGTVQRGNDYLYPDSYPATGRLLVARTGELWVMAYPAITEPISSWQLSRAFAFVLDDDGADWRVLGEDGSVLAQVRTPPGMFVLEAGSDYVIGLRKDELDVETVSVHALSR